MAIPPGNLEVLSGKEHLKVYLFGDKVVPHTYCSNCGIYVFYDGEEQSKVNLGCVDNIDTFDLELMVYDGKHLL